MSIEDDEVNEKYHMFKDMAGAIGPKATAYFVGSMLEKYLKDSNAETLKNLSMACALMVACNVHDGPETDDGKTKHVFVDSSKGAPDDKIDGTCPYCLVKNKAWNYIAQDLDKPEPGDFSVCTTCLEASVFDDDMVLRKTTSIEHALIESDERMEGCRKKVREIQMKSERSGFKGDLFSAMLIKLKTNR